MKRLFSVVCAGGLLGIAVTAYGAGPELIGPRLAQATPLEAVESAPATRGVAFELPAPTISNPGDTVAPLAPVPQHGHDEVIGAPLELYPRVKYDELDEVHPCAAPVIVTIPDPCGQVDACCGPRMVNVQICVPPNCQPRVKHGKSFFGHRPKIEYIYGEYSVEIKYKKNGWLEVEYHD